MGATQRMYHRITKAGLIKEPGFQDRFYIQLKELI